MIESLKITNFKNLNGVNIPKLSQINLISGKNNVGKSTLLEAIAIYFDNRNVFEILQERDEISLSQRYENELEIIERNIDSFSSLFTNRVYEDNAIEIEDKDNILSIKFARYYETRIKDNGGDTIFKREFLNSNTDIIPYNEIETAIIFSRQGENELTFPLNRALTEFLVRQNLMKNSYGVIKINTNSLKEELMRNLYDKIALSEKEDYLIEALKIIEPKIERLAFIGERRFREIVRPIVKLEGSNKRFPLKSMGDGVNHILSIILALVNCENGCLLIDEIDNGLHYSVQENLWRVIFDLAKKLNIQVFATTHSNDCINSFTEVLKEENNASIGGFYRMQKRKSGKIELVEYNAEELNSVSEHNIEIR
jgi:AAA15 family ATPase/GTPase